MLREIPYSTLKGDRRAYEILLLRDQEDRTFREIGKEHEISPIRARQIYSRIKIRQISLYIRHISIALGHENTAQVRKIFETASECYQDFPYACAYLEKEYKDILDAYRAGEPGMSERSIQKLPPLRRRLSQKMISRIVEMRETERATYAVIAEEMRITPEKARHVYDGFYHQKVLKHVKALQENAASPEEQWAIWRRYFGRYQSAKKIYEMILAEKDPREI